MRKGERYGDEQSKEKPIVGRTDQQEKGESPTGTSTIITDLPGTDDRTLWRCTRGDGGSAFGYQWTERHGEFPTEFRGIEQVIDDFPNAIDICIVTGDNENIIVRKVVK
jgi:hypothetical protein